jgi:hypothetical protein
MATTSFHLRSSAGHNHVAVPCWSRIIFVQLPSVRAYSVQRVEGGVTYGPDGDPVKRFGLNVLGRHSLATFLMEEGENPAVVQSIMPHAKLDMTLY